MKIAGGAATGMPQGEQRTLDCSEKGTPMEAQTQHEPLMFTVQNNANPIEGSVKRRFARRGV